ncbi:hypothetical protein B5F36_10430 [Anaerofilum sp. An201]|nr:MFS transporter [Anaerofilum sp. An201]OUP02998.1 hypothetical protein B5F36_10430 [Anaerofilum sp. An201]
MEKNPAPLFLAEHILSMTAYWVCTGPVLAKLTEYLALPLGVSNMITQLTSTLLMLQLVGGAWYGRTRHRRRYLMASNLTWRVCLALTCFTVLLPQGAGGMAMAVLFLGAQVAFQLCSPAQTAWEINAVDGKVGASFYTRRETWFMVVYTLFMCGAELLVALAGTNTELQRSFVWIGGIITLLLIAATRLLPRLPDPEAAGPAMPLRALAGPLRSPVFRRVVTAGTLWNLANVFVGSLSNLYAVRILEMDFFAVMLWSTLGNVLRAAFTPPAARMAERMGWRKTLTVYIALALVLAIGWWRITPDTAAVLYPVLTLLGSIPVGGLTLGLFRLQVQHSPAATRSVYFSANSAVSGTVCLVGASVCSALIDAIDRGSLAFGINSLFLVGTALMAATILSVWRLPQSKSDT